MRIRYTLLVLAIGCTGVVVPAAPTVHGRYQLEQVNDGGLPALLAIVPPEHYRLTYAVVVLHEDGAFADTAIVVTENDLLGTVVHTDTSTAAGRWTRSDSLVMAGNQPYTWRGTELVRFEKRRLPMMDLTLRYVRH